MSNTSATAQAQNTKQKHSKDTKPAAQPMHIFKDKVVFIQTVHKLEAANMLKNISYKKKVPSLIPVEHAHLYRSSDARGQEHKYCSAVGGHFHEVTPVYNPETQSWESTCGPAVHFVDVRLPNGKIRKEVRPIEWEDPIDERNPIKRDTHTHDVRYLESQEVSMEGAKSIRLDNQASLRSMGVTAPTPAATQTIDPALAGLLADAPGSRG